MATESHHLPLLRQRISRDYAAGAPVLFAGAIEEFRFGLTCAGFLEEACQVLDPGRDLGIRVGVERAAAAYMRLWLEEAQVAVQWSGKEILSMTLETRTLEPQGPEFTIIGFGSWATGGAGWKSSWGPQNAQESMQAVHIALDQGINWFDTARPGTIATRGE